MGGYGLLEVTELIKRLSTKEYSAKDIQEVADLLVGSRPRDVIIQSAQAMLSHKVSQVRMLAAMMLEGLAEKARQSIPKKAGSGAAMPSKQIEREIDTETLTDRELGYRAIGVIIKKWLHEKPRKKS